ncbi:hypothetical protein [Flavobacterium sp. HSC-61S13]|uniref:hypothetical protein n=1 Tax=Flavobacterium sp. HSC-61S13 TaxID=2910963 RepID=UPI0020A1EC7C|nr:hypothetical protein [Flavobacterium sp. HSC-61S13]MCP1997383.1 hypothetical protein [Flavobacterium sp. HSC-61S13]
MEKTISIDSFNPYSSKFPDKKLVTKGTLELIKELRSNGYEIIVRPENNQPIQYLFKKGIHEFFSDPLYAFLAGIPTSIIFNIASNYIQTSIDKWSQTDENRKNIIIINQTINEAVNLNNKKVTKSEILDKKKKSNKKKETFQKCFSIISPYPDLPTPIFIEHKPHIIGWGRLKVSDEELEIEESKILDKTIKRKIKSGKIKGASVTGIAEKSICNICNENYVDCNHITGEIYNGKNCANKIHEATFVEVSLVNIPINSHCLLKMI